MFFLGTWARAGYHKDGLGRTPPASEKNHPMKKLLALGVLSLAALGLAAGSVAAWWPCYPLCCKSSKCCASITIRQYNAFTPICCGNMSCNGCCPISPCGPAMCGPGLLGCGPGGCAAGPTMYSSGCESCCLGQLPAAGTALQSYQASMPAPMNARPMPTSGVWPQAMPHGMIQSASYQPMYYPGYAPMPASPMNAPGMIPWYWNTGSR